MGCDPGVDVRCCVKWTLFVFNLVFWVVGASLVAVGVYARTEKRAAGSVGSLVGDPAVLLLVVGALTFLLAFCGCVGALRENTCLLYMFTGTLCVVFTAQLAAGVIAFIFKTKVRARVTELVHAAIQEYRGDHDLQNAIDYMQREFLCCGALSRLDWNRSRYFQCSADNPSPERCGVPYSCCVPIQGEVVMNTMCGYGAQLLPDGSGGGGGGGGIGGGGSGVVARAPVFTEGCLGRVERWVDSNLLLLLGLAFGLAVLQLIGISLACALIAYVKRLQQLQQLQQQQLQQQHLQLQDMKLMMEQGDL